MTLTQLTDYFANKQLNNDVIQLDSCTTIINQKLFVTSHLNALKNNSGNSTYLPYYFRLVRFVEVLG
jgi:hypothetical protein